MWSDEAWAAIENVYSKILELDFVRGLGDGSLDQDKFLYYMQQDKLYLDDFARALALIAAKAPTEDSAMYARFSQNAAIAEQSLHDFYLSHAGDNEKHRDDISRPQKNITCELYTSFLLKHAALSPVEIAAAAILPCFWIYDAVGIHHTKALTEILKKDQPHAYSRWIQLYSSPEFNEDTKKARAFCDKLADTVTKERRQEMTDAFVKASIMELMFWRAAYNGEKWI